MTQSKKRPTRTKNSTLQVNLSTYVLPHFREKKVNSQEWVDFGLNNLFPLYLVDLYNESAVHNAIITGKVNYIVGRGLTVKSDRGVEEVRKYAVNNGLHEMYKKVVCDFELFNGFAIKVVRSKTSNKVVEFHHEDFTRVRMNKDDESVLVSDEWESPYSSATMRKKNHNPEYDEYPLFDPNGKAKVSYIYYREYRPDMNYYPYPEYVGAIPQIETTCEIAKFDLNSVKNGFSGGTIINLLNGLPPTDEEGEKIEKDLIEKFSGSENANRMIINFAEDKEHSTFIDQINGNDLAERYTTLEDRTMQHVFIGHKIISPMLFGVRSEGQLGGRREILEAYELFKETYVLRRQGVCVGILNDLLEIMGMKRLLMVEELKPINPRLPLSDEEVSALIEEEAKKKYIQTTYGVETVENAPVQENVGMSKQEENGD